MFHMVYVLEFVKDTFSVSAWHVGDLWCLVCYTNNNTFIEKRVHAWLRYIYAINIYISRTSHRLIFGGIFYSRSSSFSITALLRSEWVVPQNGVPFAEIVLFYSSLYMDFLSVFCSLWFPHFIETGKLLELL